MGIRQSAANLQAFLRLSHSPHCRELRRLFHRQSAAWRRRILWWRPIRPVRVEHGIRANRTRWSRASGSAMRRRRLWVRLLRLLLLLRRRRRSHSSGSSSSTGSVSGGLLLSPCALGAGGRRSPGLWHGSPACKESAEQLHDNLRLDTQKVLWHSNAIRARLRTRTRTHTRVTGGRGGGHTSRTYGWSRRFISAFRWNSSVGSNGARFVHIICRGWRPLPPFTSGGSRAARWYGPVMYHPEPLDL